ncbi:MAG: hypothetical protein NXI20_25310 [bacterium]|nr:hypothetical protein [bacterium]
MKKFKRIIKLGMMIMLMILAASGIVAPPILMRREKYQDKEVKTEYVQQQEVQEEAEIAEFNIE